METSEMDAREAGVSFLSYLWSLPLFLLFKKHNLVLTLIISIVNREEGPTSARRNVSRYSDT